MSRCSQTLHMTNMPPRETITHRNNVASTSPSHAHTQQSYIGLESNSTGSHSPDDPILSPLLWFSYIVDGDSGKLDNPSMRVTKHVTKRFLQNRSPTAISNLSLSMVCCGGLCGVWCVALCICCVLLSSVLYVSVDCFQSIWTRKGRLNPSDGCHV